MGGGTGEADGGMKGPEAVIGIFFLPPPFSLLHEGMCFSLKEKRIINPAARQLYSSSSCYCAAVFEMKCHNGASNIIEVKCCLFFILALKNTHRAGCR